MPVRVPTQLRRDSRHNPRRNALIRTVVALGGDVAAAIAMASVCVWLIEVAALGLFLSFLLWLATSIAALAFSQKVIHPTVQALLSDHKLDDAVALATGATKVASGLASGLASQLASQYGSGWGQQLRRHFGRFSAATHSTSPNQARSGATAAG